MVPTVSQETFLLQQTVFISGYKAMPMLFCKCLVLYYPVEKVSFLCLLPCQTFSSILLFTTSRCNLIEAWIQLSCVCLSFLNLVSPVSSSNKLNGKTLIKQTPLHIREIWTVFCSLVKSLVQLFGQASSSSDLCIMILYDVPD